MSLNDRGIGILGEQCAKTPLMGRGLEEPPFARCRHCRSLQELAMVSIGGGHVGLPHQPAAVARHMEGSREQQTSEVPGGDGHALLTPKWPGRVDRLKAGIQGFGHGLVRWRRPDTRIGAVRGGLRWWMWLRDFPCERYAEPRVLGQQIEEYRRAGSGWPMTNTGSGTIIAADLRVAVVPVHDPEPALEESTIMAAATPPPDSLRSPSA